VNVSQKGMGDSRGQLPPWPFLTQDRLSPFCLKQKEKEQSTCDMIPTKCMTIPTRMATGSKKMMTLDSILQLPAEGKR